MPKDTAKKRPKAPTLTNKKARYSFDILETIEAGIALKGSEVKSLRLGTASLTESYARVDGDRVTLHNFQIQPYPQAGRWNHDPKRTKQLLLHRREIRKLQAKVRIKGQTLIPLRIYFNDRGRVKIELALGRGRKLYDKRQAEKRRQDMKDISRIKR